MQILINNKFLTAEFEPEKSYLCITWHIATDDMTYQEYKDTFREIANVVLEKKVQKWLGDLINFRFVILPELQMWLAENINPKFVEAGLQKMAIVMPQDFFTEISLTQSVDEINAVNTKNQIGFEIGYFEDETKSQEWLFS